MTKIKFVKRNYVRKGKYFDEVAILKEINYLSATKRTRNERELMKVLRYALAEISKYKIKIRTTEKSLLDIHTALNKL